jgi:hypothetical protein
MIFLYHHKKPQFCPHSEHIRSRSLWLSLRSIIMTCSPYLSRLSVTPSTNWDFHLPYPLSHPRWHLSFVEPLEIDLVPPFHNGTIGPRFIDQLHPAVESIRNTFYLWLKTLVRLPEIDIRKARLSRSLSSVSTRTVQPPNFHNSVTRIRLTRAKHTITDPLMATKLDLVCSEGHNVELYSCQ